MIGPIYSRYCATWAELAQRFSGSKYVHFIDLTALFSDINETVYLDKPHCNDRGNVILAERFARIIIALIGPR